VEPVRIKYLRVTKEGKIGYKFERERGCPPSKLNFLPLPLSG
jgi:hypothetical protein